MVKSYKRSLSFCTFIVLLICMSINTQSYDNLNGVEYDDVIDISFVRYINGKYSITYSDDNPFRVKVNYNELNHNVVDELLGMKRQETKDINWDVELENGTLVHYEYRDTKIVRIVEDSTPDGIGNIAQIFIIIAEVLAGIIGVAVTIYILYKIRAKLSIKKCISCDKRANSKCSKCGVFYCSECSTKSCSNCGSRQYIRI